MESVALNQMQGFMLVALLLLARLLAIAVVFPGFGARFIPQMVRFAVAASLALACVPTFAHDLGAILQMSSWTYLAVLVKEAFVGLVVGLLAGVVLWAAQAAGWLMDTVRGHNLGATLLGQSDEPGTPLASLFYMFAFALFFGLGGHRLFIAAVAHSYHALPLTSVVDLDGLRAVAHFAITATAQLFVVAFALAAPVMAVVLLTDVTLGWISRFVPQMNAYFLASPIKAVLAIVVLLLVVGSMVTILPEAVAHSVSQLEALFTQIEVT